MTLVIRSEKACRFKVIASPLPDGTLNSKRVLAPYEIQYIADEALFVGATYLDLGIEDPFQMTEPQLMAVMGYL